MSYFPPIDTAEIENGAASVKLAAAATAEDAEANIAALEDIFRRAEVRPSLPQSKGSHFLILTTPFYFTNHAVCFSISKDNEKVDKLNKEIADIAAQ